MLKNYFKIAIRNLFKQRLFTLINVSGLALGIACCIIIGAYIRSELSYDRFHRSAENVFRVLVNRSSPSRQALSVLTPRFLSNALSETFPEIESATQFRLLKKIVGTENKDFPEARLVFTDSSFFDVFTFRVYDGGDPSRIISQPNGAVITRSFARNVYGDENPIGKVLRLQLYYNDPSTTPVQVAAIIEDVPPNSHFKFDLVVPYGLLQRRTGPLSWNLVEMKTYLRFRNQIELEPFQKKLADFVNHSGGSTGEVRRSLVLMPLTSIHLSSEIPASDSERTNLRDIYIFASIALLVLIIACINYVLLVTARLTDRIKEVGVRKVVGASSVKLILQFLVEALVMALIAMPLALLLVDAGYQGFSQLLSTEFHVVLTDGGVLFWGSLSLIAFFTVTAGLYPAFFFAKISSIASLKGRDTGVIASHKLRKLLIITQFCITITLFVCVSIMYDQLNYTQTKDLGYRVDNILVVKTADLGQESQAFKQIALSHSAVDAASFTGWLPGYLIASTTMPNPNGEGIVETEFVTADCDLIETFEMQLVDGRDFDCNSKNDTLDPYMSGAPNVDLLSQMSIVLNESAVRAFGLDDPIGRVLKYPSLQGTVIGIIKDIHNRTLHDMIKPMVIQYSDYPDYLVIAYQPGKEAEVVEHLRNAWSNLATRSGFDSFFLKDHLEQLYLADRKLMEMTGWFAGLAIALSSLGLFGLAGFMAETRTKEIGIRKVLGASVRNVVALLSKDLARLVLLSNLLAWPIAWYTMNRWLENFAYRVDIGWPVFAIAGGMALLIALATVCTQAIRAAAANPVESLRYE